MAACLAAARPATFRRVPPTADAPPCARFSDVILLVLELYIYLLIASAVLSWLVAFNVVNARNQFVAMVGDFLYRITEPVLRPIRNMLPSLGGIDVSPVVLILIIILIKDVIYCYIYPDRLLSRRCRAAAVDRRSRRACRHGAADAARRPRRHRRHRTARRRTMRAQGAGARRRRPKARPTRR